MIVATSSPSADVTPRALRSTCMPKPPPWRDILPSSFFFRQPVFRFGRISLRSKRSHSISFRPTHNLVGRAAEVPFGLSL